MAALTRRPAVLARPQQHRQVVLPKALPCPKARTAVRTAAAAVEPIAPLAGDYVIKINAGHRSTVPFPAKADPGCNLEAYMKAFTNFSKLEMGLGGYLERTPEGEYYISVPKMEFLEVWFEVKAKCEVSYTPKSLVIYARQGVITGSQHVEALKLNDKFKLNVRVEFEWQDIAVRMGPPVPSELTSTGDITVFVDIPAPFNIMPKPVLEGIANATLGATMTLLMNGFVGTLKKDYAAWASTPAIRDAPPGRVIKA